MIKRTHPVPLSIEWVGGVDGFLRLLDQTQLPVTTAYRDCHTLDDVWEAIKSLRVRGAPAIGVAAAYGVVIGMRPQPNQQRFAEVSAYLRTSRPTAVNLFWALDRIERRFQTIAADTPPAMTLSYLLAKAHAIRAEDATTCRAIGQAGAHLIPDGGGVLTHCNTGGLATAEYGTALAVLFTAAEQGRRFRVFADETRPLLQGARLTMWELQQHGLDATLITDNMAAQVMKEGRVKVTIVGADRIAANGDTANKIGTYGVAVLAKHHSIPFYVAAPLSTFDLTLPSGDGIPIEQRDPREVTHGFGKQTAPDGVAVYNPAFDVTPHELIAGIITERGVIAPVNAATVQRQSISEPRPLGSGATAP
jgi:methylthioribose-1-phosphate isomerase